MINEAARAIYSGLMASALLLPVATVCGWWLARFEPPILVEALPWLVVLVPPGLLPVETLTEQVVAGGVLAFPLLLLACRAAFDRVGPRWGAVARALGDTRGQSFGRVELPLAFPGLLAAAALGFARAATVDAAGWPAAIPAVLVYLSLSRTHHEVLRSAGG